MSDPFSGIPDPGAPRPIRGPSRPGLVQEAFRALRETLRPMLPAAQRTLRRAQQAARDARWRAQPVANRVLGRVQRQGQDLWARGKRYPRTVGAIGGAVALTLVGAIALSASGAGRSLCPPTSEGKTPQFRLLMDQVPQLAAGSQVEIHYDVCGLASGTTYQARIRLLPQKAPGKKKSAKAKPKPKPMVVSFKDRADGLATRRHEDLDLGSTKPGAYTLELTVTDKRGRARKRVQKVLIKAVKR
jgi:hypothetical protein